MLTCSSRELEAILFWDRVPTVVIYKKDKYAPRKWLLPLPITEHIEGCRLTVLSYQVFSGFKWTFSGNANKEDEGYRTAVIYYASE